MTHGSHPLNPTTCMLPVNPHHVKPHGRHKPGNGNRAQAGIVPNEWGDLFGMRISNRLASIMRLEERRGHVATHAVACWVGEGKYIVNLGLSFGGGVLGVVVGALVGSLVRCLDGDLARCFVGGPVGGIGSLVGAHGKWLMCC